MVGGGGKLFRGASYIKEKNHKFSKESFLALRGISKRFPLNWVSEEGGKVSRKKSESKGSLKIGGKKKNQM